MGNEAGDESFLESLGDEERDRLATLVADNFATQVLIDGFYHADPHSGNVLIHPDATVVSTSDATDVGTMRSIRSSPTSRAASLPPRVRCGP